MGGKGSGRKKGSGGVAYMGSHGPNWKPSYKSGRSGHSTSVSRGRRQCGKKG